MPEVTKAIDIFAEESARLGVFLNDRQKAAFLLYMRELIEWNSRFNLTAITDPVEIAVKHFLDSILFMTGGAGNAADIGSGAGFPGIPVIIANPEAVLSIIEKNHKKTTFLLNLVSKLSLKDRVTVCWSRIEDFRPQSLFDTVYLRGVNLDDSLLAALTPLLKPEGKIVYSLGQKETPYPAGYEVHEREFVLPVFNHKRKIITLSPARFNI